MLVSIGPKVQMDGRGSDEQGRADDDHEADHGSSRPASGAYGPPGSNITVAGHAAPTRNLHVSLAQIVPPLRTQNGHG